MDINAFEINIWRKWKNNKTGEVFAFSPAPYDNEQFNDYKEFKLGLVTTPDNKLTYPVGYKICEVNSKVILQIMDATYEIKKIEGSIRPAIMEIIDNFGDQIDFTEMNQ